MVKINGEWKDCAGQTVGHFLEENGYKIRFVAVEVNEKIVPKSEYENTVFRDEDQVEIVSFVQGG